MKEYECPNCEYETLAFTEYPCPNGCTEKDFKFNHDTVYTPPSTKFPGKPDTHTTLTEERRLVLIETGGEMHDIVMAERGES